MASKSQFVKASATSMNARSSDETNDGNGQPKPPVCLLVLGMHRSGTSMLARVLNFAGYSLSKELVGATASNQFGHWEPKFLNDRNQQFLEEIGSDWHDWGMIDPTQIAPDLVSAYRTELSEWIRAEKAKEQDLILKEPRACRLAPLIVPILNDAGFTTRIVIPYRNPLDVAGSLQKRDGLDLRKGTLLWLRHVLEAEYATRGMQRSFVDYDALLSDWRAELSRMAKDLSLNALSETESFASDIDKFITKKGRHNHSDATALRENEYTCGMALSVVQALNNLCANPNSVEAQAAMDDVRSQLDETEWLTLGALRATEVELSQTKRAVSVLEERNREVSVYISNLKTQIAAYKNSIAEYQKAISVLEERNREVSVYISNLKTQIAAYKNSIAEYQKAIDGIYASVSWRVTVPLRATKKTMLQLKVAFGEQTRTAWAKLPVSQSRKENLKGFIVPRLAFAIGKTEFYKSWKAAHDQRVQIGQSLQSIRADYSGRDGTDGGVLIREENCFVEKYAPLDLVDSKVRMISFYLPQYHAIAENDEWWGPGFTEWTNVQPATPKFPGHYQPHEPIELGYYNLLDTETQARQVALAKLYGIGGFCFYWYWFSGKRLLEKPVENWLNNPDLDFPFCICWANENWSRRWDGRDSELLVSQNHSPEDDLAFIVEVAPYLLDSRYIRIDGKPLMLVYRPSLLPNAAETAERWRRWCRENGVGEIYLAYTQSFESVDPADYGFDAAIEFPPNNYAPVNLTEKVPGLVVDFGGIVHDWRSYVVRSCQYPKPDYKLYRSVCPSWDNTARRKLKGSIFANSNPADYRVWLENAITRTLEEAETPDEKIIFCNAWNEWAEGAHLEPDTKYGYAYLEASRAALNPHEMPRSVTLVGHDAHPHGAQLLLLNLARSYTENGIKVDIVLLSGGVLVEEYSRYASVTLLDKPYLEDEDLVLLLRRLRREHDQIAIANTTVSASILPQLKVAGYKVVSLIHEMASVFEQKGLRPQMEFVVKHADRVVFPAPVVHEHFENYLGQPAPQAKILPQGLYLHTPLLEHTAASHRARIRSELAVDDQTCVLLGVGYVDHRKGADLFIRTLVDLHNAGRKVRGIWIGHVDVEFLPKLETLANELGVSDHMQFLGRQSDPQSYYAAADVFLLTSREDPYPSVVLEAMAAEMPVVMFGGATGSEQLAKEGLAVAVPAENPAAMARAIGDLLDAPDETKRMTAAAARHIRDNTDFTSYTVDLLALTGRTVPRVSVIVPNYNYARHIQARLDSVLAQDFPIYEVIVLDDCSTDESLQVIHEYAAQAARPIRIIPNQENSGNVFRQWIKGLELAKGDYIWIAEADDLALPDFLTTAMRGFEASGTVLSYTDSAQIDEDGNPLAADYRYYTDPVSNTHWAQSYVHDGQTEIAEALYLKNTIPNASGVVMQAAALSDVLTNHREHLESVRFVGDWLVYLWMMERGGIAFNAQSKNIHRRHQNSVTISNFDAKQFDEIKGVQEDVQKRHKLGAEQQRKAKAYLDELAEQFGLNERSNA
ncbi:glycoside hydrolase family 99-like domain-containing protein [Aliiroseovarius sediminis]|uniref:glycoside hydrolase family 99-like domain-containing protein n=1 Tax=Aliiroseovarius sediminis TaxID=2925839 RepID=UPI001F55BBAE|nr:glycoside hydrolase family 99-like domain-containing protein [Aliiroseovarius sediminis]MCI2395572.1 glycoside hydrolase family 99-like domain-containing protein [Aliiroseovarius sediminis]